MGGPISYTGQDLMHVFEPVALTVEPSLLMADKEKGFHLARSRDIGSILVSDKARLICGD